MQDPDERGLIIYDQDETEIRAELDGLGCDGEAAELTPGPRGGFLLTGEDAETYANHRGLVTTELKDLPGYTGDDETPEPPADPTISSLTPSTAIAGAADTTVTVAGSGFEDGATVVFNGADAATTFTDASNLSFVAPTAAAAEGSATVSVRNPGGGVSSDSSFTLTAA